MSKGRLQRLWFSPIVSMIWPCEFIRFCNSAVGRCSQAAPSDTNRIVWSSETVMLPIVLMALPCKLETFLQLCLQPTLSSRASAVTIWFRFPCESLCFSKFEPYLWIFTGSDAPTRFHNFASRLEIVLAISTPANPLKRRICSLCSVSFLLRIVACLQSLNPCHLIFRDCDFTDRFDMSALRI